MGLYSDMVDIYNSRSSLRYGNTFTHQYKMILSDILVLVREYDASLFDNKDTSDVLFRLDELNDKRINTEAKLLRLFPEVIRSMEAMSRKDKKNTIDSLGRLDAKTDGVGRPLVSNLLGLPGSEARAVDRIQGKD